MNNLPLEVIEYIALIDHTTWLILVQIYKFLADKSFDKQYCDDLMKRFLQRRDNYNDYKIMYYLPNSHLYNYDEPSVDKYGHRYWFQNTKFHRDHDLPAIIYSDGRKEWWQNGKCHRDNDLPAVMTVGGYRAWYQHGKCHRDYDQPAIIYSDGRQLWYQDDKFIRRS